jgi:SCF-associated factor 1
VILNSIGQLFIAGILNGERFHQIHGQLIQLQCPASYPATAKTRYEPTTAIRQYSVGRSHVLGLSDSGKIWEWSNHMKHGQLVKFVNVDVSEDRESIYPTGKVKQVVAGM